MWKGGVSKKCDKNSEFIGPLKERIGKKNPMFGRKHSTEAREKMRIARINRKYPMSWGKHSAETKEKIRIAKLGDRNPNWKGNSVGYYPLHQWCRNNMPKPQLCEICKKVPPYDLANISGEYKRELSDWEYLCRSCHMKKDGRSRNGYIKLDRTLTHKERI